MGYNIFDLSGKVAVVTGQIFIEDGGYLAL